MKGIQIVSTGKALPEEIITNDDLSRIVDTNDEWITTRTGIKKRYRCTQENTTSLAVRAAYEAVEASGVDIAEIGAVIVATSTADNAFPSTAAIVQKELGLAENVLAFDLSSACTGFLHALNVGQALFNSTDYKYILLIGSEQMSKILDYTDRSTCVLFGDGAGAVLIKAADNMYRQINYTRGDTDVLVCRGIGAQDAYVKMNGNAVFRFAVDVLKQGIDEILKSQLQELMSNLGLDMTTFFTMAAKQAVREQALPFHPDMNSGIYGMQAYKLAMKNTNYNSEGKATVSSADEWNDETEWDDISYKR